MYGKKLSSYQEISKYSRGAATHFLYFPKINFYEHCEKKLTYIIFSEEFDTAWNLFQRYVQLIAAAIYR